MPLAEIEGELHTSLSFPEPEPEPSLGQLALDALNIQSADVAIGRSFTDPRNRQLLERDPDFSPFDHLQPGEEPIASRFAHARNLNEVAYVRGRIRREQEARQRLNEAGLTGVGLEVAASIFSPFAILSGGAAAGIFRSGGMATRGAAIGLGDAAAQEAVLQATQFERPMSETVASVLGGTFIGGAAGAVLGRFARDAGTTPAGIRDDAGRHFDDALQSVGAAAARLEPDDTLLQPGLGLEKVLATRAASQWNPLPRLLSSPSATMRDTVLRLGAGAADLVRGTFRGRTMPQSAEIAIRYRQDAALAELRTAERLAYRRHRAEGGRLTEDEFFREVDLATRRGDKHVDRAVEAHAKFLRDHVYDPRELQRLGLLPTDLKVRGAESYAPRALDFAALERGGSEFRSAVSSWLRENGVVAVEADDLAERIYDAALSSASSGRLFVPDDLPPGAAGILRERTLNVPDEVLRPWLQQDARPLADSFLRTSIAEAELSRALGGVPPQQGIQARAETINEEYQALIEAEASAKVKAQLQRRRKEDLAYLQTVFQRVRGKVPRKHTVPQQLMRTLANYTPLPMLGTVIASVLPDVGTNVMKFGLARTMGATFETIGSAVTRAGLVKSEAQKLGQSLDGALATRQAAMYDAGAIDPTTTDALGKLERGSQKLANKFFRVTLLNQWTDMQQRIATVASQNAIFDAAAKVASGRTLSRFETRAMAANGLSEDTLRRIHAQRGNFVTLPGGSRMAGIDAWDDREAARLFMNAVAADVRAGVIEPGALERSFLTEGGAGKLLLQFRSWGAAATTRILLSGLQRRDMAALNGILVMSAMGALTAAVKDVIRDGEVRERTPEQWAVDAIDRAGFIQLAFELNSLTVPFAGQSPLGWLMGNEPDRYRQRRGLTAGTLAAGGSLFERAVRGIGTGIGAATGDTVTDGDIHSIRMMLPLQNLLWVSWAFDLLEEGITSQTPATR